MLKISKQINNPFLLIFINVLLITAAQLIGSTVIIAAALLVYLATMLISDDENVFPLMLFFLPWSTILKLSPSSISFYSISTILVFGKYVIKYKKIEGRSFIPVMLLCIVTLLSKFIHSYSIAPSFLMFFIMLVAFPMLFQVLKDKINFETCVIFFSLGIISATIISLIFSTNPNMVRYIEVIEQENIGIRRLCGFYGDPNFYSAQIVTAICGLLLIITKKTRKKTFEIALALLLFTCGTISVSKSFLICILTVFTLWLLFELYYKPSKFIGSIFAVAVVGTVLVSIGLFDNIIEQYQIRFVGVNDSSSLTTGRVDLWVEYAHFLIKNPFDLFFGQGYTNIYNGVSRASHNTLIELLYQFGIIGFLFLVAWLHAFKIKLNTHRCILLYVVWGVACFAMWIGLDLMFLDDFFVNITLFSTGCNYIINKNNCSNQKQKTPNEG